MQIRLVKLLLLGEQQLLMNAPHACVTHGQVLCCTGCHQAASAAACAMTYSQKMLNVFKRCIAI